LLNGLIFMKFGIWNLQVISMGSYDFREKWNCALIFYACAQAG
jgi:hypothetical protein